MSVLFGLVEGHLACGARSGGTRLGTSGRAQDVLYVANAEDMWELFRVDCSDMSGKDRIVVSPFPLALGLWGIDCATAAKFIEDTVSRSL